MRAARALTLLLGVAGIALVALAGGRVWAVVSVDGVPGMDDVRLTGRSAAPGAFGVALACAAMLVVVLIARKAVRYLVAAALAAAGVYVTLVSVHAGVDAAAVLAKALDAGTGLFGVTVTQASPDAAHAHADLSAWPWASVVGGVLLVLAGALAMATGHLWPGPARRFERPAPAPAEALRGDPVGTWDSLSRGEDPT